MEKLITVLTPTYNRANNLTKLYLSLKIQSKQNFKWLIIDDGSVDNTKEIIDAFIKEDVIEVLYYYKNNGGKHTALNLGISYITTELTFIVDSDDYLTVDSIETIEKEWENIRHLNLCGMGFLKGFSLTEPIIDTYPLDHDISDYNTVTKNQHVIGDKAEVWVTEILKKYPFPEYKNENFFAEGYVWSSMAMQYQMLLVNKIIYIAEYLENGLTKSGRKLRISCPLGGMRNASILLNNKFILRIRIKNALLYNCYGFFANYNIKKIIDESPNKILIVLTLPYGYLLYKYWKYKFM